MDLQHIINCLTALHLNTDKKNEASFDIENILIMLLQYKKEQALQLQQTGVSGSIYGYTLEIKSKNYKGNWFRHYNHKLYKTVDSAENAIEQMKDYSFYSNFEWRIVALYCH